jgi:tripartite-type tricarboxylate transporter receptor subunit TctC
LIAFSAENRGPLFSEKVVKRDDLKAKFRTIGLEPTGLGVADFSALYAAEVKRWVAFLTERGLRK